MRRLFLVFAKLFGLFQIFSVLQAVVTVFMMLSQMVLKPSVDAMAYIIVPVVVAVVEFLFFWIMVFKTEWLADRLGLSDGEIILTVNKDVILNLGIQLVGLYVLITALPSLVGQLAQLIYAMQQTGVVVPRLGGIQPNMLVTPALKVVAALVLLLKTSYVVGLIVREQPPVAETV